MSQRRGPTNDPPGPVTVTGEDPGLSGTEGSLSPRSSSWTRPPFSWFVTHVPAMPAFPSNPVLRACRAPPEAGRGHKHASPGKGETHWKSRLGVSVSTVTGESLHVYQCGFREITPSRVTAVRPG